MVPDRPGGVTVDRPAGPRSVAVRIEEVRRRIRAVGTDPGSISIVAVTKGFGADAVAAARSAGLTEIGENYAGELQAKAEALAGSGIRWHYLGAVQRNKVARLAPLVSCWQTVSRLEEGRAIARRRPGARVLVQVDVAGIAGRGGCPPDQAADLVGALREEPLDVEGLMAVGPPGPPAQARPGFALLSRLADRLDLPVRSMGMSDDLEVALSEGSTMVRLGRALFGDRPPKQPRNDPASSGPAPRSGPGDPTRGPLTGEDGHPPAGEATH